MVPFYSFFLAMMLLLASAYALQEGDGDNPVFSHEKDGDDKQQPFVDCSRFNSAESQAHCALLERELHEMHNIASSKYFDPDMPKYTTPTFREELKDFGTRWVSLCLDARVVPCGKFESYDYQTYRNPQKVLDLYWMAVSGLGLDTNSACLVDSSEASLKELMKAIDLVKNETYVGGRRSGILVDLAKSAWHPELASHAQILRLETELQELSSSSEKEAASTVGQDYTLLKKAALAGELAVQQLTRDSTILRTMLKERSQRDTYPYDTIVPLEKVMSNLLESSFSQRLQALSANYPTWARMHLLRITGGKA